MRAQAAVVVFGVGILSVFAAAPAWAHHAFAAEFDANSPIELNGTVVRMEWVNPHTWIHIDVTQPGGSQERWMIEGGPPTSLLRRGFTKASLLAGTEVYVEGFRGEGRIAKSERPGRDVRRREQAVSRFIGHGRAERWKRPDGITSAPGQ